MLSLASRGSTFSYSILACLVGTGIGLLVLISPWLALAVILGVIICVIALSKPVLLCYLIVGSVALTSGMERGTLIPFLKPNEVILLLCSGLAFIVFLTRKTNQNVDLHPLLSAIIVLVVGTMLIPSIAYLLRGTHLTTQDWLTLLAPLQYVLLFWLFAYLPNNNSERRRIIHLMLLCGAVVAAVGLLQAAKFGFVKDLLDQWYSSSHEINAASYGRITSLMSAWNGLGIFMMVNLIIAWAFGISRPAVLGKGFIIVVLGLCIACLVISGSYAGIIGLVFGVFIITFLLNGINHKTIILFLSLAILIIPAIILFRPLIDVRLQQQFGYGGIVPHTLLARFNIWQEIYLPAIQQNPLWGVNPTIPLTYSWLYTESQYLSLIFSFGLIGLTAFLAWIGLTLSWLVKIFRHHNGLLRPVTAIIIAIIFALSVTGFTNEVFSYAGTADYLWIILALVTATEDKSLSIGSDPF